MLRKATLGALAALATLTITPLHAQESSTAASPASDDTEAVKALIWAKEKAIYAGRARGDVSYYIANASPRFLAWTSGTEVPFRADVLEAGAASMKARDKEVITSELMDFSLSGDTAIIYYRNHRKRLPDGTAVDQYYDNIHVWQKTNGDWKVLASMSRHKEDL